MQDYVWYSFAHDHLDEENDNKEIERKLQTKNQDKQMSQVNI
jgi:hypothetical protein